MGQAMTDRIDRHGLAVAEQLAGFIENEALPGSGVEVETFWREFSAIVHDLAPKNRALLARREELQQKLDRWYLDNGTPSDMEAYEAFLREIGYLQQEGPSFKV